MVFSIFIIWHYFLVNLLGFFSEMGTWTWAKVSAYFVIVIVVILL
jgi:hypothetical protein